MLPEKMRPTATRIEFSGPSGADAVDAGLKLCRRRRAAPASSPFKAHCTGCLHAAMTATGLVTQKDDVAGRVPDVHFFPYPYPLRCPLGRGYASGQRCLAYL